MDLFPDAGAGICTATFTPNMVQFCKYSSTMEHLGLLMMSGIKWILMNYPVVNKHSY
jgi:hypothetical protein